VITGALQLSGAMRTKSLKSNWSSGTWISTQNFTSNS
jgi:hypothetical protein